MSRGINKVILIGNLGTDPELRYTPSGSAVANFSVATSDRWRDKTTGEQQERTEWHRIVCFNRLGEIAGEYSALVVEHTSVGAVYRILDAVTVTVRINRKCASC